MYPDFPFICRLFPNLAASLTWLCPSFAFDSSTLVFTHHSSSKVNSNCENRLGRGEIGSDLLLLLILLQGIVQSIHRLHQSFVF